jgi:two-component system LytT family response regulator
MIKAIIIDDEPLARLLVKEHLQNFPQIFLVEECNDGFEGLKAIGKHQPDIIFLDIQMPKITGFEMLELMDAPLPGIIFTTAYDEYAMKAFEANATDYLLKPFSKDRFEKAIQKWLLIYQGKQPMEPEAKDISVLQPEDKNRIVVKKGTQILIIPVHDIFYIEAYDDYVKIYTPSGVHVKKKTMNYYEQTLDTSMFLRVHRSYIVHIHQITRIEPIDKDNQVVILKSGARIPVSRSGYQKLKLVLGM